MALLAFFAELQVSERATVSNPNTNYHSIQNSRDEAFNFERYITAIGIGSSEKSCDGPPQQLDEREHDGWEFSASRCRE